MPITPKEMAKRYKKAGFRLDRVNGSHYIYVNDATKTTVTIPMHSKDLKKGLESALLKTLKKYGGDSQ